jgi:hypothetical protein
MSPITTLLALLPLALQEAVPVATRLLFELSPAVDLYFFVRARAEREEDLPGFESALDAVRKLNGELGSFLAWGPIEGSLKDCHTLAQVGEAFRKLPESFEARPGTSVELRTGAERLFAALKEAERPFYETLWQSHEEALGAALGLLQPDFEQKLPACLAFHMEKLGMKDPGLQIPVYLVTEAPVPGAVTHRDGRGKGVCFVAVQGVERTQLYEIVLHEATHALDVATPGASALEELRAKLAAVGVGARERAMRDLPHTLMFVQAAESIRRTVDPAHEDYGEVSGYYAKIGKPAELVRGFWRDHLDGKSTRAEALDAIAQSATEDG